MSMMTCSDCGLWAADNEVTWYCDYIPETGSILTLCEQCEEWAAVGQSRFS